MHDTYDDDASIDTIGIVPMMLEVVCLTAGLRFAAVARVTETSWTACAVRDEVPFGYKAGDRLPLDTTLCRVVRDSGRHIVINHVDTDPVFKHHPAPAAYGFQSYISMPIFRRGGEFFGTLCAFDPLPAQLDNRATVGMFRLFADLIGFHLDALDRMASGEAALSDERRMGERREQFIAILGHDLRNPLASVEAGTKLLQGMLLSHQAAQVVAQMQKSVWRMAELIDHILDFARGRLGDGLFCIPCPDPGLTALLEQVVQEQRLLWPDRAIHCDLAVDRPVYCDGARVGQLFSNLLANALIHGVPTEPVRVHARCDDEGFVLSVINDCDPIPPERLACLFQPFSGASPTAAGKKGLGLGLYIALGIAEAHGGTLEARSTRECTCFTCRIPPFRAKER